MTYLASRGRGLAAALLIGLALAACGTPRPVFPELDFAARPALRFDVAGIELEQSYAAPIRQPHVDHLAPVPPADAALRWAEQRLEAAGTSRRLRYDVTEAGIVEVPLETTGGIKGLFLNQQSKRYEAEVAIEVTILADDGFVEGQASVAGTRSSTLAENASEVDRQRLWFELTRDLMADLDRQLETTLTRDLAKFLLPQ